MLGSHGRSKREIIRRTVVVTESGFDSFMIKQFGSESGMSFG